MFLENKYYKWYTSLVENARTREVPVGYIEKHHCVPKSLGGGNNKENLVKLTAREHFVAHRLLTKFTEGKDQNNMVMAIHRMIHGHKKKYYKINSRLYEKIREAAIKIVSSYHIGNKYNLGKKRSVESRERMRQSQLGKKQSIETINKRIEKNKGKKRTLEQCQRISNSKYNIHHTKESNEKNKIAHIKYNYIIEDYLGNLFKTNSLNEFCKENNLDWKTLNKTLNNKKFHKKSYRIISKEKIYDK